MFPFWTVIKASNLNFVVCYELLSHHCNVYVILVLKDLPNVIYISYFLFHIIYQLLKIIH